MPLSWSSPVEVVLIRSSFADLRAAPAVITENQVVRVEIGLSTIDSGVLAG